MNYLSLPLNLLTSISVKGMPNALIRFVHRRKRSIRSINLETARTCNLTCVQCATHSRSSEWNSAHSGAQAALLSLEVFNTVLPFIDRVEALNLDNHGEPLLNPHLEEMIRRARRQTPRLRITLTSNFMKMTAERSAGLLEAGIDGIQVSVNGTTAETYENIMRGASLAGCLNIYPHSMPLAGHPPTG